MPFRPTLTGLSLGRGVQAAVELENGGSTRASGRTLGVCRPIWRAVSDGTYSDQYETT